MEGMESVNAIRAIFHSGDYGDKSVVFWAVTP
jgi:hypothetical protein